MQNHRRVLSSSSLLILRFLRGRLESLSAITEAARFKKSIDRLMAEYEGDDMDEGRNEDRVLEWEIGLPSTDDLTPLSQLLVPPELASAFSISPEPYRSDVDVDRASQKTLSELKGLSSICDYENTDNSRKSRRIDPNIDSEARSENFTDDLSNRTSKRARLVWTPQLHKRFVDAVAHLGIKNAVPKTIMQLMNVEGLTRENVASHLQKYRLYLKRFSNDEPSSSSSSDHLDRISSGQGDPLHLAIPILYPPPVIPMAVLPHGLMNTPMASQTGFSHNRTQQRDWWGSKSNNGN